MSKPIFRIKEIAKEKGISIKTMASRIGIGLSALSQSIDGNPTAERLQEIADALGVDIVDLFEKREEVRVFVEHQGERREITAKDIVRLMEEPKMPEVNKKAEE